MLWIRGFILVAFSNYFKHSSEIHQHYTRYSTHNFYLPSVSSNSGQFSLKFSGIKTWNSLDNRDKLLPRKSLIKRIKINQSINQSLYLDTVKSTVFFLSIISLK